MEKEEIMEGIKRLKEIKQSILDLVGEAEGILKDCNKREFERAQPLWINRITTSLEGRMELWNMEDSIEILEGLLKEYGR